MSKRISEYERWKEDMKKELDRLVAENFERLYNSRGKKRLAVWGEIASALYGKYGLTEIRTDNPEYEFKRKKEHCVYVNMRLYVEKEFPWELSDPRTYRFVRRHRQLPKRLPEEWANFELEERVRAGVERRERRQRLREAIRMFEAAHPEYALRQYASRVS